MPRALLIFVTGLLFTSCVAGNNRDLTSRAPFSACAGRTVTLLRPVYVFDCHGEAFTMPPYNIRDGPINRVPPDYGLCRLPAGHLVHVDSIRLTVGFDSGAFPTALGHTFVPELGKEVEFYYYWGWGRRLQRAPWEPLSVPDRSLIDDLALLP